MRVPWHHFARLRLVISTLAMQDAHPMLDVLKARASRAHSKASLDGAPKGDRNVRDGVSKPKRDRSVLSDEAELKNRLSIGDHEKSTQ